MNDERVQELSGMYKELNPEARERCRLFLNLRRHCPGFNADLKAAKPEGEVFPAPEVVEALMDKWSSKSLKEMVL